MNLTPQRASDMFAYFSHSCNTAKDALGYIPDPHGDGHETLKMWANVVQKKRSQLSNPPPGGPQPHHLGSQNKMRWLFFFNPVSFAFSH